MFNAVYKLYTAILNDWGQVENNQIGQILLYSIAADDETPSHAHSRTVGQATVNPGQVGIQIDTLNDAQSAKAGFVANGFRLVSMSKHSI